MNPYDQLTTNYPGISDKNADDAQRLRGAYIDFVGRRNIAHNTRAAELNDANSAIADFAVHHIQGENLFAGLLEITSTWGAPSAKYNQLEEVFSVYLAHHGGDQESVKKTFRLFSVMFKLVATIMEYRDFIDTEYVWHKDLAHLANVAEDVLKPTAA